MVLLISNVGVLNVGVEVGECDESTASTISEIVGLAEVRFGLGQWRGPLVKPF